jgi:uptake hydrogenase small subunit
MGCKSRPDYANVAGVGAIQRSLADFDPPRTSLLKFEDKPANVGAMPRAPKILLWLQAGSCGGCSMSVQEQGAAGWFAELKSFGVHLLWRPSVSEESAEGLAIFDRIERGETRLDILCAEGAVLRGPDGSRKFNRISGTDRTLLEVMRSLAARAGYCVAIGTRAAFGGLPACGPDPADACGLHLGGAESGGVRSLSQSMAAAAALRAVSGIRPPPNGERAANIAHAAAIGFR